MNRIDAMFDRCRAEKRAALILFITSGYPHAATTRELLPVLADSGCDLIELGVPFSDPIADGPIIQRSSTIALEAGMTLPGCLEILQEFRKTHETPVVLFGALNPFLVRGYEASADAAREAGADGVLAADLPAEEAAELRPILLQRGLHLVNLVAPTTPTERFRIIAENSSGFVYCISMKGTTGQSAGTATDAKPYLDRLRSVTALPLALGFGVSKPEHVRAAVAAGADGVVVGSALISLIDECQREGRNAAEAVGAYVRSLAGELKRT